MNANKTPPKIPCLIRGSVIFIKVWDFVAPTHLAASSQKGLKALKLAQMIRIGNGKVITICPIINAKKEP